MKWKKVANDKWQFTTGATIQYNGLTNKYVDDLNQTANTLEAAKLQRERVITQTK